MRFLIFTVLLMAFLPITKWNGLNVREQADEVWERSHLRVQGGYQQLPKVGVELVDLNNVNVTNLGIGKRKGSVFNQKAELADTWAQVGNDAVIAAAEIAGITALTATRIAFVDTINDDLRTYDWDGTDWTQTGNDKNFALSRPAIAALNSTDIAFIDATNDDLRVYRFDGTDWNQVGNDLNLPTTGTPAITALNETDIAFIDETQEDLRTYRFDGTDWVQVGNDLKILGVANPALSALNGTDVAFIDSGHAELRTYRFDGDDWAQVGLSLAPDPRVSITAIAALNETDIAYITERVSPSAAGIMTTYRFDGSEWKLFGSTLTITGSVIPSLCALTSNQVAFIDDFNKDLRTYRFTSTGKFVDGIEWLESASKHKIEVAVFTNTIFIDESGGGLGQINDSTGAAFFFDSPVTKVTFVKEDGHLFFFSDGKRNNIQAYRKGKNLDPEMKLANVYTDAFGSATHTMTGVWPTGAYLAAGVNSRLAWGVGNPLLEYTPMSHTPNTGIWDLTGSTAGRFHARSDIILLANFIPDLANSIEQTLFVGTESGFEITTGFLPHDRLVALNGSTAPLNHRSFFISDNWLVYLGDDKSIRGVNRQGYINLGRRFTNEGGTGPLDGMVLTASEANSFGFYESGSERGSLAITTASGRVNDTWLVLDFGKGEPKTGETEDVFERRVRCLVEKIKDPDTNDWFSAVYQMRRGLVGALVDGNIYDMKKGFDDLGGIPIEAHGTLSLFTGGDEFTSRKMQWQRAELRSVESSLEVPSTLYLDIFEDGSSTPAATFSKVQEAQDGQVVKNSHQLNRRSESIQLKFYNNTLGEDFRLSSMLLIYQPGKEIRSG